MQNPIQHSIFAEREVLDAFARQVCQDYPNTDRVGCPERAELAQAAKSIEAIPRNGILDHLACCGPCLSEFTDLRRLATDSSVTP